MEHEKCGCFNANVVAHVIIIILLIVLFFKVYKMSSAQSEFFENSAEGGYLSRYLNNGYAGHPLVDSVDDSGADLRILGQQFSSTDQGSEKFKNTAQLYK